MAVLVPFAMPARAAASRYEAENATISQGVVETTHTGYSGTGYVNADNVVGSYVEFTITAASPGTATITIRYANGTTVDRPSTVALGGTAVAPALSFPPTANWNTWASKTITTAVNAGTSTVRITGTTTNGPPNLDYIDVDITSGSTLNPNVAPGGNFNLSLWQLQLPTGSPGSPTTISPAQLQGPTGFQDQYFFTNTTDGSMSFWDPENGVTTPNSNFPRCELREMTASGAAADWAIPGTHILSATLKVTQVPSHVAVGQIHLGSGGSTKPLLELFYYSNGNIEMAIEQTPAGGNEVQHLAGNVPLGTKWSYVISLSGGNQIGLVINGGTKKTWTMSSSFTSQYHMYFKAGDYDQSAGSSSTVGARVQFYALNFSHG